MERPSKTNLVKQRELGYVFVAINAGGIYFMLDALNIRLFTALGLLSVALCCGCGKKEDVRLTLQPAQGKLLVDGKPPVRAMLTFHPDAPLVDTQGRALQPTAVIDAEGKFRPSTYTAGDGLPAGKYNVTVEWPKITVDQGEEQMGPDQLGGRYKNPKKPAATITVQIQEGEMDLPPIDLKTS
jgi:hypothetical protein